MLLWLPRTISRPEHIIEVAARLLAALGYDATSTKQIAEAAGVEPSVIDELFGGRQELYVVVMERAFEQERLALESLLGDLRCVDAEDCARAIHLLMDGHLDFVAANSYIHALWTHRWLSDAMDVAEIEKRYSLPLLHMILDVFQSAIDAGHLSPDADLEYILYMSTWCIHGFALGGVPDEHGNLRNFTDEREWRRFRLRLHQMVHRTLMLPGEYSP
ncbi:TetR/AcrR family transcriptional regulator [Nonomuraea sp. LPB2021202275-12-8]|uniref:TetR/AcrR family transcriptional regulator n=1 Tax=Nonomuraea sp. LPB2021202275-12-8 TaxID=3120159 RepID=UPI00300C66E3